jgi:lipid-A-disaccharide synthase-like uncharacterized protein
VQWLSSEREKKSVIPPVFWYYSIAGAMILLAYAIHKRDLVFIGQSTGLLIYVRNLQLVRNERQRLLRVSETEVHEKTHSVVTVRAGSNAA